MNERENLLEPEVEICKSMESFLESAHSIAKTEEKTKNYSYFTIFSNKYMALRYEAVKWSFMSALNKISDKIDLVL